MAIEEARLALALDRSLARHGAAPCAKEIAHFAAAAPNRGGAPKNHAPNAETTSQEYDGALIAQATSLAQKRSGLL